MSRHFFEKINYSASNEDSESERQSLLINNQDTVLCITGSGSRSLDLLIDEPKKIISIDLNKTQNLLLELKIAAFKCLSYEEFSSFIGLSHSTDRLTTFERIKHELPHHARSYWSDKKELIINGVLYCGTWEKLLIKMLKLSKPRTSVINLLMTAESLDEQQAIWTTKWDNKIWNIYLKFITNQFLWKYIVKEPGSKFIPKSFDVYRYMKKRLDFMGMNVNMKKSHYANLLFYGHYKEACILPHHLREENFETIKNNIHKVEIVTESLSDFLTPLTNQISAFSLSDFSSYADAETYNSIWGDVIKSAKDGAKFCERQFLVKRSPEIVNPEVLRNDELENSLVMTDESFIYTFCVGKISKS